MNCNIGGDPGTSVVADVAAGSQVTFKWDYVRASNVSFVFRVAHSLRVRSGPRVSLLATIRPTCDLILHF